MAIQPWKSCLCVPGFARLCRSRDVTVCGKPQEDVLRYHEDTCSDESERMNLTTRAQRRVSSFAATLHHAEPPRSVSARHHFTNAICRNLLSQVMAGRSRRRHGDCDQTTHTAASRWSRTPSRRSMSTRWPHPVAMVRRDSVAADIRAVSTRQRRRVMTRFSSGRTTKQ